MRSVQKRTAVRPVSANATQRPANTATPTRVSAVCACGANLYNCGVGATPVYLVKAAGCYVVGLDLLESMVEQSQERAMAEGEGDSVEFTAADARRLPSRTTPSIP